MGKFQRKRHRDVEKAGEKIDDAIDKTKDAVQDGAK
jgi:hypothetical protein